MVTMPSGLSTIAGRFNVTSDCGCSCMVGAIAVQPTLARWAICCSMSHMLWQHAQHEQQGDYQPIPRSRSGKAGHAGATLALGGCTDDIVHSSRYSSTGVSVSSYSRSNVQGQGCGGYRRGYG